MDKLDKFKELKKIIIEDIELTKKLIDRDILKTELGKEYFRGQVETYEYILRNIEYLENN